MTRDDDTSPMADADSDTGLLPDADCIDLLASNRRRTLLRELLTDETDDRALQSLATAVAQTEQDTELGAVSTRRVEVSLHHVHLPKLDDAGVLDYDREQKVVTYHGDDRIETWLETMHEE